jgi:hypothetical protein
MVNSLFSGVVARVDFQVDGSTGEEFMFPICFVKHFLFDSSEQHHAFTLL